MKKAYIQIFRYICILIMLILVLHSEGCLIYPHLLLRYNSYREDENSNVAIFLDHRGGYPRKIEIQILVDGEKLCEEPVTIRNSETINSLDIRLEKGTHRLYAKIVNMEIDTTIEFELLDEPLYFMIEYENSKSKEPSILIKKLGYRIMFV